MPDFSYIGKGQVYLREVGATAGLLPVGNVSELSFSVEEDVKELADYTGVGGGTYNEVRRIKAVNMTAKLHDFSAENLARAVYGSTSAIPVTPIAAEPHIAYVGAFIPTDYPAEGAIVVSDNTPTVLTEDTDYEVTEGGITILSGGALSDGDAVTLAYTPSAGFVLEALTSSGLEYEMDFQGLNEARTGKPFRVQVYRWKPGATQGMGLIADDFGALDVSGKLLKDSSRTGNLSQYFSAQVVN